MKIHVPKKLMSKKTGFAAASLVVIAFLVLPVLIFRKHALADSQGPRTATASGDCIDNNTPSIGTVTWTSPGNAFSNNATYASASVDGTTTHWIKCTNYGFTIPAGATINGIVVAVERKSSSTSNGGSKDAAVRTVKGGTIGTTDKSTATTYTTSDVSENHGGTTDLWGDTWTDTDINSSNFGAAFAVTKASAAGAAHTVTVDVITVTVYYTPAPPPTNPLLFALKGYIWENDDEDYAGGDANDGNSQLAAANTAITVPKGSQVNLRMQVNLSGGDTSSQQFGAFYDRSDGIWSKIGNNLPPKTSNGSNCNDGGWTCTSVDTASSVGYFSSMAVSPSGVPWVSYQDGSSFDLRVAHYVGSGGSGCASSSWSCETVDSANSTGWYTSIAFDSSGSPWVSYYETSNNGLRIAHYVGSGGTGCTIGATWNCTAVIDSGSFGGTNIYTSIAVDSSGAPWVSYNIPVSSGPKVAHYVGSGGTGCSSGNTAWTCTTLGASGGTGYSSITLDSSGKPWVSYGNASGNSDLFVAHYVGSGGTNCATSTWDCTTIETTNDTGEYTSIAVDSSNNPWISYYDFTNSSLRVARYVNSGGTGCDATSKWTCTAVVINNDVGNYTSIAFDSSGSPWVSYYNATSGDLELARYVSSSGNGCADSAWTCTPLDTNNSVGAYSSLAFDGSGNPWVSYYSGSSFDLMVAHLDGRAGELLISPASGGLNGDSLNESHVDMTSVTDTSNRDDADCVGGGTWTNGMLALSENITQALTDAHCTEITLTIDTSQAVVGRTYRIILATNDNWRKDKGLWRGFNAYDQYATITISDSVMRAGKDNQAQFPNCSNTSWGCAAAETTGDTGIYSSMVMDPNGNPWVSYYDQAGDNIKAAHYVGTGGSNCATSAWNCTTISTTGGSNTSIALDSIGRPWISYYNGNGISVANYVGSGGNCTDSAWNCTTIKSAIGINGDGITFDASGTTWVAYSDITSTDLYVAHYVGSGGSGCSSTAWTCTAIDTSSSVGWDVSMTSGASGLWITYYDITSTTMKSAHYVGSGGTGCASGGWTCTTIDSANTSGVDSSTAIDSSGNPWVSYYRGGSSFDLRVAKYVGSGGNCGTSNAWTCTAVDTTGDMGSGSSIAMDSVGNAWVSYSDATNNRLRLAQYVSSGGTGCAGGVTDWSCSNVNNINAQYTSIAFDNSGSPWISYADYNGTNLDLQIAKLHHPSVPFSVNNLYQTKGYNAGQSFARHKLSPGSSPNSTDGTCGSAITDYMGTCAWFQNNGQYDTVVAQANEAPNLTMAMRFSDNSKLPTIQWFGRSSYAPSTAGTAGDIVLQVYRYGSTNAWETVASDSSSTDCSAPSAGNCGLSGIPSGTTSDYFYNDGAGGYWVYCRLYQEPNTGSAITFKTDEFNAVRTESRLRHGQFFQDGISRPLNWR